MIDITKAIADRWALIAVQNQCRGIAMTTVDGLIAATALEHELTLVTRNVKDFANAGVSILNPWVESA